MAPRDIRRKFRNSELALLGWRSQEMALAMEKKYKKSPSLTPERPTGAEYSSEGLEWDQEADVTEPDFSQMTGEQQVARMRAIGFAVPFMLPSKPPKKGP